MWIAKALSLAVLLGVLVFVLNQQRQIVRPGKESCPSVGEAPVGCIPVIEGVPWAVLVVLVLVGVLLGFGFHNGLDVRCREDGVRPSRLRGGRQC